MDREWPAAKAPARLVQAEIGLKAK
jgi:hypothetical protein